jgi:hypothetical protein
MESKIARLKSALAVMTLSESFVNLRSSIAFLWPLSTFIFWQLPPAGLIEEKYVRTHHLFGLVDKKSSHTVPQQASRVEGATA